MSVVKVFISYCIEDNTKMEFVKNLINNHPPLKALVIINEKTISNSLKGFISKSNDLNYRFDDDSDFESVATKLVSELFEKYKNQGKYHIN